MNVAGDAGDYSTCAGFFDADGDGDLDLIVGGYALWNKEVHAGVSQVSQASAGSTATPTSFEGQFGRIFRNEGAAGFTEQTDAWGFKVVDDTTQKPIGKNLGFGFGYFNEDRILDVVVANDQVRNLFLLSEDATFVDRALERGFAYDRRGKPSAAMGIDVDLDLATKEHRVVMGNFYEEMTSLYVNAEGATSFIDESVAEELDPVPTPAPPLGHSLSITTTMGTAISSRSMARFGDHCPSSSRARWGFHTGSPAISSGIAVVAAAPPTSTSGALR